MLFIGNYKARRVARKRTAIVVIETNAIIIEFKIGNFKNSVELDFDPPDNLFYSTKKAVVNRTISIIFF